MELIKAAISPYSGNENYVFVSYSHRNTNAVIEIIKQLQHDGYRVWYDEGIDPGSEWDENIADHVEKCFCFLAFLSKEYIVSSNCKDELNFARELDKPRLLIYLEDIELPSGLRMRLSRLQAIHMYRYANMDSFYEKLADFSALEKCRTVLPELAWTPSEEKLYVPRNLDCKARVLFLLDTSGSMAGDRIAAQNAALSRIIQAVDNKYNGLIGIDIMKYDTFASWRNTDELPLTAGGLTNIGAALGRLNDYDKVVLKDTKNVAIVLTNDGYATDVYREQLSGLKNTAWFKNAHFVGISIGESGDPTLLGEFIETTTNSEADIEHYRVLFSNIADELLEETLYNSAMEAIDILSKS